MALCSTCGTRFDSPFCPQCGTPAPVQAQPDTTTPQLKEREVVENQRIGRDVEPKFVPTGRVVDDGRGLANSAFPIEDSKENATLSWDNNSPAHEALQDADERGLPFYRKSWFWALVTIAVVLILVWICWELFVHAWISLTYSGPRMPNSVSAAPAPGRLG